MALIGALTRISAAALYGAPNGGVSLRKVVSGADRENSGAFKVAGSVAVSGAPDVPVSRLVVLFDKRKKTPIRITQSDSAGNYEFINIQVGPWFVVAFDHTGEYNAVIADNIFGEPM